jgi:hypothetical protein
MLKAENALLSTVNSVITERYRMIDAAGGTGWMKISDKPGDILP